jgi:hypothetical protein
VGSGAQSWLTHTSDLCRFRKLWPLRIWENFQNSTATFGSLTIYA